MESQDFIPLKGGLAALIKSSGARLHMERWVLPTRVVDSPREGEASKLGWQAILSCPGIVVHSGMAAVVVSLPMLWHGMAWRYSAGCDNTVGMAVVH